MSLLALTWRARAGAAAALIGAVLVGVPTLASSAHADGTGQLTAQVQSLLARVHHLQKQATAVEARYSKAVHSVQQTVDSSVSQEQSSTALAAQASAAQQELDAKVRGLYESGGPMATFASMLTSGNVTTAADQSVVATHVLNAQIATVKIISQRASNAEVAASHAVAQETKKVAVENRLAIAAARVQTLLTEQKVLLAKADKRLAAVRKAQAALAAETANLGSITSSVSGIGILPPSVQFLALYKSAATTCPGLSWSVLAAIGQVESGHGRNDGPSSAGAMGPMQFEPATFASYAVDGDHDGAASIMDPADSIYTAAHYLCANGAGRSPSALSGAILHYNHAAWYVQMVLGLASKYAASGG